MAGGNKNKENATLSFCSRSFAQSRSRSRALARGDGGGPRARASGRGGDRQGDRQPRRGPLQRPHVLDDDDVTAEGCQRDQPVAPSSQLGIDLRNFSTAVSSAREIRSHADLDGSRCRPLEKI